MTSPRPPKSRSLLWVGILLTGLAVLLALLLAQLKLQASLGKPLPVYGTVADFHLTNQMRQPVSLASLLGKVWVADVIFTRCPGPCLKMTRQMKDLQNSLGTSSQAKLVTVTTDPSYDTPDVLATYAGRFDADSNRWMFLTGLRDEISKLATNSFKVTAMEKPPTERESPLDLFIHSTIFVIVDKKGQLRGTFETTGEGIDPLHVRSQILAGIRRLEREK